METELLAKLDDCREWRAARLWLWDDDVTVDATTLKGLSPAERTTLCEVLGVSASGRVAAVCERIVEKVARARFASPFLDDMQATDDASFRKISGMNRTALLAALGEIPGGGGVDQQAPLCRLREALAAGRWLFFHCRQGSDFDELPESARATVEGMIGLPRQWKRDARHGALEGFVRDWRADANSNSSAIRNSSADITAGVEAMDLDPPGGQGGSGGRTGRGRASLGTGVPHSSGVGPDRAAMGCSGGSGGGGGGMRDSSCGYFHSTSGSGAGLGHDAGVLSHNPVRTHSTGGGRAGLAHGTRGMFHSTGGGWTIPSYCTGTGSAPSLAHAMGGGGSNAGTGYGGGAASGSAQIGCGGLDLTSVGSGPRCCITSVVAGCGAVSTNACNKEELSRFQYSRIILLRRRRQSWLQHLRQTQRGGERKFV